MKRTVRPAHGIKRWRDKRGSVAVEAALVAPILFLIIFGVIDFSRAYYTLNSITGAVREGARYASSLDDPLTRQDEIKNVVRFFALTMGQDSLLNSQILVTFSDPQSVKVEVFEFPFEFITPLPWLVGLDDVKISRAAIMKWERAAVP